MPDHRLADDLFPAIVAHRGASSTHPENTLPAFEEALRVGAPIVELDVRLSADGVPVVMHDPTVDRTTDGSGAVSELTARELATLDAGRPDEPATVPSLAEVLELVSGRAAVALEIKNLPAEPGFEPDREPAVEAALAEVERTRFEGPVLVVSFNPSSIEASRAISPEVPTGFLTTELVDPHEALRYAVAAGHAMVLPGTRSLIPVGPAFVQDVHAAGLRIGTWTVDDPEVVRRLLDWGTDAVASNDPAMALRVLGETAGVG
jgi:glycerophosphoryl diester phosphodiesterase